MINGGVSYWLTSLGRTEPTRSALGGDVTADVAIVGGGLTGLWTAYYLAKADPTLRIVVLEAEFCGYGASGRNGGWLTAALAGSRERYARTHGRDGVLALQQAMKDTVDEVIDVLRTEGVDADVVKGGELSVACSRPQVERLRQEAAYLHGWGDEDHEVLDAPALAERVRVADAALGLWTPHCARVHPAKLVLGLAEVVERLGVTIHESSPVTAIEPRRAVTPYGTVTADVVVRATEGFTARIPGLRRTWLPMNSAMLVTEPLADDVWDAIGWDGLETIGDMAHAYMYAQRTADGRIAIGGRGVPYRYASTTDQAGHTQEATVASLRDVLVRRFPQTADARIDHAWAGVLGVPRDWCSTVTLDRGTGLAAAGGYTGHGVATTNLAGRTLRDLILDRDSALVTLPWVGRRARRWEPEPLRWLGVQAMYAAYRTADRREDSPAASTTSWFARVADRVSGR
ncbi:glycine/D-amino acid oxidase-like deaminating enzyme [Mumia flava]|uniref:Glycine/D-amino acid oxidase-like deaminating enzyme n=1 Tax=Mumia flava TaxID=1348852 RepID=A0A0B2B6V3_9ACTN|nr:FAD-binding oxidoreductase [Mumia flava]PJJ57826.1 glycine/D-amino acid oxidase-like deaminating enzyme [Mumia flava]